MNTDELISSIFVKNALWDQKDPQHHNRYILDKLWDDVASEMKSTRTIVRAKWKSLRDTFRKELSKIPVKRSGDGASETMKPSWQYFDCLSFLKDQFIARSSGGNLPNIARGNTSQETTVESAVVETENESNNDDSMNETQAFSEVDMLPTPLNTPPSAAPTPTPTNKRGLKRKAKTDDDISTALIRIEESKLQILQNRETRINDEDSSFFDSLLPHVRTLPPAKKMLLRMQMQQLVYTSVYGNDAPKISNISHTDEITTPTRTCPRNQGNNSQLSELQNLTQEYSNPTSISSYISTYSDEYYE